MTVFLVFRESSPSWSYFVRAHRHKVILWEWWYFVRGHHHEVISWESWSFVRDHDHEMNFVRVSKLTGHLRNMFSWESIPSWKLQNRSISNKISNAHMIQIPIHHKYNRIQYMLYNMQLIPITIHSNSIQVSNHYIKSLLARGLDIQPDKFLHILLTIQ
jgi:hypothetical protein